MRDNLALCLILKDEAESIKEVIKSFWLNDAPVYDRLIISIDSATTDNTYDIVKKYTPEISYFDWEDNFSKPRNQLIDEVEKNWYIIFPDGHEVLRPLGLKLLNNFLSEEKKAKINIDIYAPFIEIDVNEYDEPWVIFKRPILFKNTGTIKFNRAIHNFLLDSTKGGLIELPQIRFIHNMPPKRKIMRAKTRSAINIKGLIESLKIRPNNIRELFYLGDSYDDAGKPEKAILYYQQAFKIADKIKPDIATQICICMMNAYCKLKMYEESIEWGLKGIANKWDRAEIYYYLGVSYSRLNKFKQAIHWYKITASMEIPTTGYFILNRVYTWYPWDGIAFCKTRLKDYKGALKAALKVATYRTDSKGKVCPKINNNIELLNKAIAKSNNMEVYTEVEDRLSVD